MMMLFLLNSFIDSPFHQGDGMPPDVQPHVLFRTVPRSEEAAALEPRGIFGIRGGFGPRMSSNFAAPLGLVAPRAVRHLWARASFPAFRGLRHPRASGRVFPMPFPSAPSGFGGTVALAVPLGFWLRHPVRCPRSPMPPTPWYPSALTGRFPSPVSCGRAARRGSFWRRR